MESQAEFESCDALMLIRPAKLEDYRCMRDFARPLEGVAGERLSRAIEGRGAFSGFVGRDVSSTPYPRLKAMRKLDPTAFAYYVRAMESLGYLK